MTGSPSCGVQAGTAAALDTTPAEASVEAKDGASIAEATADQAVTIIIGAYPGTEELMARIWDRFHSGKHKILTVEAGKSLRDIFTDILKDSSISDRFSYLPANMVPCTTVGDAVLMQSYVYVNRDGRREFSGRVPMTAHKDKVTEILLDENIKDDEAFAKALIIGRAMEVGYSFGNFITPVLRANPCENVVIEAFLRKFFVAASPDGFEAIASLTVKALLKE